MKSHLEKWNRVKEKATVCINEYIIVTLWKNKHIQTRRYWITFGKQFSFGQIYEALCNLLISSAHFDDTQNHFKDLIFLKIKAYINKIEIELEYEVKDKNEKNIMSIYSIQNPICHSCWSSEFFCELFGGKKEKEKK